jgi:hypothetical protein
MKPANVGLVLNVPELEAMVLCPDCARELAKEILDSVPEWELTKAKTTGRIQ